MLNTMTDVISFYCEYHATFKFKISQRIDSKIDITKLQKFGLPGEYLNFLQRYEFENCGIGGAFLLNLLPIKKVALEEQLEEYLRLRNAHQSTDISTYQPEMLNVSSFDGGEILVKKGQSMHNDSSVFMWEIESRHFEPITKIADSYEQFVIINSNRDYFLSKFPDSFDDYDLEVRNMNAVLDAIYPDISDQGRKLWRWLI